VSRSGPFSPCARSRPLDPIDGNALGNLLLMNGAVVPYQTFVVVP
jgi:hypothetical protein